MVVLVVVKDQRLCSIYGRVQNWVWIQVIPVQIGSIGVSAIMTSEYTCILATQLIYAYTAKGQRRLDM